MKIHPDGYWRKYVLVSLSFLLFVSHHIGRILLSIEAVMSGKRCFILFLYVSTSGFVS